MQHGLATGGQNSERNHIFLIVKIQSKYRLKQSLLVFKGGVPETPLLNYGCDLNLFTSIHTFHVAVSHQPEVPHYQISDLNELPPPLPPQ